MVQEEEADEADFSIIFLLLEKDLLAEKYGRVCPLLFRIFE